MPILPSNVPTGKVTGNLAFVSEDTWDADTKPELTIPAGTVTFTASVETLRMPAYETILLPLTFEAVLDFEGNLVPKYGTGIGIDLPATNSPFISEQGFTYRVDFALQDAYTGKPFKMKSFNIQVPVGTSKDLSTLIPIDESGGVITLQGSPGRPGEAARVTVGTTTTGNPGTNATVTQTGTEQARVLNFTIPRGAVGETGPGVPAGGTALQLLRKNTANTTTEWTTPNKALVGLSNVDNTSDANKPVSTATQAALEGKVSKGDEYLSVLDYGVVPQPITATSAGGATSGIQNAIDAAYANYKSGNGATTVYFPEGLYTMAVTTRTVPLTYVGGSGGAEFFVQNSTACLIVYPGVSLRGAGVGKTILKRWTTGPSAVIETVDYTRATISDMSIRAGGVGTNTHGIFMSMSTTTPRNNKDIWFRNLEVGDCGYYGIGHQYGSPYNLHFEDLWIHDVGKDGIDHKVRIGSVDFNNNGAVGAFFNNILIERFGQSETDSSGIDLRGQATLSNITIRDFGVSGYRTLGMSLTGGEVNGIDSRAASARTTLTNFYIEGKPDMTCVGLHVTAGGQSTISNGVVRWCTNNSVWVRESLGGKVQFWRNGPVISNIVVEGSRDGTPYRVEKAQTALSNCKTISDIETFDTVHGNLVAGQTVFALRQPMSTNAATRLVVKNDMALAYPTDWTLSGQTVTLVAPVAAGDRIEVININTQGFTVAALDVVLVGESHDIYTPGIAAGPTAMGRLTQAGNQITKQVLTYSRTGESAANAQMRVVLKALGLVTDNTVA